MLELTEQGQDNQKRKVIQSGQAPSLLSLATFKRFFGFQENKLVKTLSYLPSLKMVAAVIQLQERKTSFTVFDVVSLSAKLEKPVTV